MSYVNTDKNTVDAPSLKSSIGRPSGNPNDPRLNFPEREMDKMIEISRQKMNPHRSISDVKIRNAIRGNQPDTLITFIDNPQVLKSEQQPDVKKVGVKSACEQCKGTNIEELGYYLLGEIENFETAKPVSAGVSKERKILAGVL